MDIPIGRVPIRLGMGQRECLGLHSGNLSSMPEQKRLIN